MSTMKKLNRAIGAEIKRIRKKSEMNQVKLAPILGLDQSALSRVENGAQSLSAAQWVLFCRATETRDGLTARVKHVLVRSLSKQV